MWWIVAAGAAVVSVFWLLRRNRAGLAFRLSRAAQGAYERKDFDQALNLSRQALSIAGLVKEPLQSQLQAQIEVQMAAFLYRRCRLSEADELFRRGFSKARAACRTALLPAYVVWGDLCADEGRYPEAEQHYTAALDAEEARGNLASMIFVLQKLGDAFIRQGRRDEAEAAIQRAMELETRVVHDMLLKQGKDPAKHHVTSWSLPDLHFCQARYDAAAQIYRSKVEHWEQSVTRPDNIDLGHLQMRLAECEAQLGRRTEAAELYARAANTFEREWGATHPKTARAREAKAELLAAAV